MSKDILTLAREAGIDEWWDSGDEHREVLQDHLKRFAALVRADEREACWEACDRLTMYGPVAEAQTRYNQAYGHCKDAIRARSYT